MKAKLKSSELFKIDENLIFQKLISIEPILGIKTKQLFLNKIRSRFTFNKIHLKGDCFEARIVRVVLQPKLFIVCSELSIKIRNFL